MFEAFKARVESKSHKTEPENLIWQQFVCSSGLDLSGLSELESMTRSLHQSLQAPFASFGLAMTAVSQVVCMPFKLLLTSLIEKKTLVRFTSVIRQLEANTPQVGFLTREQWVAHIKIEAQNKVGHDAFGREDKESLDSLLRDLSERMLKLNQTEANETGRAILFQAVVSLWTAYETLLADHIRSLVNLEPMVSEKIYKNQKLKQQLLLDRFELSDFAAYNYELKGHVGDLIFLGKRKLGKEQLRELLDTLYGKPLPTKPDYRNAIELLGLRRDLIVHKYGVCDQKYRLRSGERLEVGEKIVVTPGYVIKSHQILVAFALELAAEATQFTGRG